MRTIIILFFCICSIICIAQNKEDSNIINYQNICFNDVCLGDNISTMIKKWGNPDSIYINKYSNEDNYAVTLREYYYFDIYDHNKYMEVITSVDCKDKIIQFINKLNKKFQFEDKELKQIIKIDDDTTLLKRIYFDSYCGAKKFQSESINTYTKWYKRDIQTMAYRLDKNYKLKIDSEYENRIKGSNNIEVVLNIPNAIEFYSDDIYALGFKIQNGKIVIIRTLLLDP